MYFCRSIHERQERKEFGYTKTLLRKQRTSVIFYSMDRVKEVYKVTIAGSIINVVLLVLKFVAGILGHSAAIDRKSVGRERV